MVNSLEVTKYIHKMQLINNRSLDGTQKSVQIISSANVTDSMASAWHYSYTHIWADLLVSEQDTLMSPDFSNKHP